ncbi:unnamed protein product [Paramecium octaurelia]|uniref:Uncharacterized protein n=1 Tax=Paramecium octaurelia TaxID=43137 RepID=A0A8S1W4Z5_PAROT|nr:unnamed protein product [Paramecium octaurelia]
MYNHSNISYTNTNSLNRQELQEFRNYVRKTAQAKMDGTEDKSRQIAKTFHLDHKNLMSLNQSPLQSKKLHVDHDISQHHHLASLSDWKKFDRSTSQSFVSFDANTWKEDQNSMRQRKLQTPSLNAADLIKVNRTLSGLSTKEIQNLSGQYYHQIQELEHTVSSMLRRIDYIQASKSNY